MKHHPRPHVHASYGSRRPHAFARDAKMRRKRSYEGEGSSELCVRRYLRHRLGIGVQYLYIGMHVIHSHPTPRTFQQQALFPPPSLGDFILR